jgi:hypothetical protein
LGLNPNRHPITLRATLVTIAKDAGQGRGVEKDGLNFYALLRKDVRLEPLQERYFDEPLVIRGEVRIDVSERRFPLSAEHRDGGIGANLIRNSSPRAVNEGKNVSRKKMRWAPLKRCQFAVLGSSVTSSMT